MIAVRKNIVDSTANVKRDKFPNPRQESLLTLLEAAEARADRWEETALKYEIALIENGLAEVADRVKAGMA